MSTFQQITIIGYLGNDPETINFEGGGVLTKFSVATTEVWNNKQTGERQERTEWHNILTRNKTAEICEKYLNKGSFVLVVGKLQTRKWQDQQGNDRWTTEINANQVKFLGGKNSSSNNESVVEQYQNKRKPTRATIS